MSNVKWEYALKNAALNELFFILKSKNKIQLKANDKDLLEIVHSLKNNSKILNIVEELNGFKLLCFYSKIFDKTDLTKNEYPVYINYNYNKKGKSLYTEDNLTLSIRNNSFYSIAYSLTPYIADHNIDLPNLIFDYNKTIDDNINTAIQSYDLSYLEVINIFLRQKNIVINNNVLQKNKSFQNIQNFNNITSKSINTLINSCVLEEKNNDTFDDQRNLISKAFDHQTQDYNLFLFQDGTGTGKSHNVIHNFINTSNNNVKQNLIFMAPQKGQMFLNFDVYKAAMLKDIPLLYARSIQDIEDWSNKDYLSLNIQTQEFETLKDFFIKLFKIVPSSSFNRIDKWMLQIFKDRNARINNENNDEISVSFGRLNELYKELYNLENNTKPYFIFNQEELDTKKTELHKIFRGYFFNIAKFFAVHLSNSILMDIFQSGSTYTGFHNFSKFGNDNKIYEFIYKTISFAMPFEAAKYKNSIIYLTIDKSTHLLYISEEHYNYPDEKTLHRMDLPTIISGYDINYKSNVNQFCLMNNSTEISDFLQQDYFSKHKKHYFSQNNIGFSVVIDEEHLSYDKLSNSYTSKEITSNYEGFIQERLKVNIIHAMNSMNRWKNNVNDPNFIEEGFINMEKKKLVNKFFNNLIDEGIFNNIQEVCIFLDFFHSNDFSFKLNPDDYGFVKSLTEQIITLSPKEIFHKEFLNTISLLSSHGAEKVIIAKDLTKYSTYISQPFLKFFQTALILLISLCDISEKFKKYAKEQKDAANQNAPLYSLILLANENKKYLENILETSHTLSETDPINFQFAYFLRKICFSLKINKDDYDNQYLNITPVIAIINEMPEVSIYKMLLRQENKVFLMSATRGYENIYSGNFSENFFIEINKYHNIFKIFKRENSLNNPMPKYTETLFNLRKSVTFSSLKIDNSKNIQTQFDEFKFHEENYLINNVNMSSLYNPNDVIVSNTTNIFSSSNIYLKNLYTNGLNIFSNLYQINRASQTVMFEILNCITHSIADGHKHSLIFTLNHDFIKLLSKTEVRNIFFPNISNTLDPSLYNNQSFEININDKKIRFIFYDANLSKTKGFSNLFVIDNNTQIILISSISSAGTGLNFIIETPHHKQDFENTYCLSDPFYSCIKTPQGYSGIFNQLILMKSLAHNQQATIKDLSEGLNSHLIKSILEKEHVMDKTRTINQMIARSTRSLKSIHSKFYFVDNSLYNNSETIFSAIYQFAKSHEQNSSHNIISNLSYSNKSLLKTSTKFIDDKSFDKASLNKLRNDSSQKFFLYHNFFSDPNFFANALINFQNGNYDYFWFKEFHIIIKNYVSANYDLSLHLKNFLLKHQSFLKTNCPRYFNAIKDLALSAEISLPLICKPITLQKGYINQNHSLYYSDLTEYGYIVNDENIFSYIQDINVYDFNSQDNFIKKILNIKNTNPNKILTKLPNPYLLNLIKGNIAEGIFSQFLNFYRVNNNISHIINEDKIYEIFDFYIQNKNTIYCIDIKSWSIRNDLGLIKTLGNVKNKLDKLEKMSEFQNYKLEFIYLNMHPNLNTDLSNNIKVYLNNLNDKNINYLNFFERDSQSLLKLNQSKYKEKEKIIFSINNEVINKIIK